MGDPRADGELVLVLELAKPPDQLDGGNVLAETTAPGVVQFDARQTQPRIHETAEGPVSAVADHVQNGLERLEDRGVDHVGHHGAQERLGHLVERLAGCLEAERLVAAFDQQDSKVEQFVPRRRLIESRFLVQHGDGSFKQGATLLIHGFQPSAVVWPKWLNQRMSAGSRESSI